MRYYKIIPWLMGKLYKDHVKVKKRDNYCLTNPGPEVTIV